MSKNPASKGKPNLLVLGIGNLLLQDEGVGVLLQIADQMHTNFPDTVQLLDGGTGGIILLEPMEQADKIILIDATIDGQPAGTVTRLTPRFSADYPRTLTAHDIGLKDLLDAFHLKGTHPNVVLFAVSIDSVSHLSVELNPPLKEKLPHIAQQVIDEIHREITSAGGVA